MRRTPKQIAVAHAVRRSFVFRKQKCDICHDLIQFEFFYHLDDHLYNICTQCATSKEEAYDLVVKYRVTAGDVARENDLRKLQADIDRYRGYEKMINDMTKELISLPDGEVSPQVYNVIIRYIT